MALQSHSHTSSHPQRCSRRIRGLAPSTRPGLPGEIYLPNEICTIILQYLQKKDLKKVRLVSKYWSSLATIPLFDRVFVSPRKKDLEVWEGITGHPTISRAVRTLVYDTTKFKLNLSYSQYYDDLVVELDTLVDENLTTKRPFDSGNAEVNEFIRDLKARSSGEQISETIYDKHRHDRFVAEGYHKYMDIAESEQLAHIRPFMTTFVRGLRKLSMLQSVVFSDEDWMGYCFPDLLSTSKGFKKNVVETGSPLCREWNLFHIRPLGMSRDQDFQWPMYDHFQRVTTALAKSKVNIVRFALPYDGSVCKLPPCALSKPSISNLQQSRMVMAYSNLKVLELAIRTTDPEDYHLPQPFAALSILLDHMSNIEALSLDLSSGINHGAKPFYRFEQVFPSGRIWKYLRVLYISGLSLRALDLISLGCRLPSLRKLRLRDIDLHQGTWQGTTTALRKKKLRCVILSGALTHCGDSRFDMAENHYGWPRHEFLEKVETYITRGGRHPCLGPNDGQELTLRWFSDLLPDYSLPRMKVWAREVGLKNIDAIFGHRE